MKSWEWLSNVVGGLYAASMLGLLYWKSRLLAAIRSRHPTLWVDLGEPRLLGPSRSTRTTTLRAFLFQGRYRQIGDVRLVSLAKRMIFGAWVALLSLVLFATLDLLGFRSSPGVPWD